MNLFFQSILTVLAPLLFFFLPGIALVPIKEERHILAWVARVMLWSISLITLVTFILAWAHIPAIHPILVLTIIFVGGVAIYRRTFFSMPTVWYVLAAIIGFTILYAAFTIPYLLQKDGLPTGDAQKTIYWADIIQQTKSLPDYAVATPLLNRDPVDFYTPGLHTLSTLLMGLASWPLASIGLFAIACSIAAAVIAGTLAKDIFDTDGKIFPATLVIILVLTNIRFLRYLREPGYHLQNVVGELLLFGLLMLAISLIHRWRTKDAILALCCGAALVLTHQFSAFIGALTLIPVLIGVIVSRRHIFFRTLKTNIPLAITVIAAALFFVVSAILLHLDQKIPNLFTTTPHLINELPTVADYPRLLGGWWLILGILGLGLLLIHTFKKHEHYRETGVFCASTIILLILSQGPRFYIDIPPVRALFYLCIPLSICGAYSIAMIHTYVKSLQLTRKRILMQTVLSIALAVGIITSLIGAFSSTSLEARTNSTLTPQLSYLIDTIIPQLPVGAILTDDYGDRAASWVLLTHRPTFSRLASDIRRPMQESRQSAARRDIYLKQLDFEKIYDMGSSPLVLPLLEKHSISAVVGSDTSSYRGFIQNSLLKEVAWADSIHIFTVKETPALIAGLPSDIETWLLKPTTLVNDIGDNEDLYDYLPISLSATQLSDIQRQDTTTYRTTTAPIIDIVVNMSDYTQALWDKDGDGKVDTAMEFFIKFNQKPSNLTLGSHSITSQTSTTSLLADELFINEKGHIVVTLQNPTQEPISIDMIAFGSARVP